MKNLVVCYDGTGGEWAHNTNVMATYSLCKKSKSQRVFYDPGVATGGWEYSMNLEKFLYDFEHGIGTMANVEDGYHFLMKNYNAGDKIFIFGFSRGAFTARSLASMVTEIGLLPRHQKNLIPYATRVYNTEHNGNALRAEFARSFCLNRMPPIEFVGVWDTVEALTKEAAERRHNAMLTPNVKCVRHAVAIDEFRPDFRPSLLETEIANHDEVWFAGAHSDVGGNYKDDRRLSNIALNWMLWEARVRGLELTANATEIAFNLYPTTSLGRVHNSYFGWESRGAAITRTIPENALIDYSVVVRLDNDDIAYAPKNLPDTYRTSFATPMPSDDE